MSRGPRSHTTASTSASSTVPLITRTPRFFNSPCLPPDANPGTAYYATKMYLRNRQDAKTPRFLFVLGVLAVSCTVRSGYRLVPTSSGGRDCRGIVRWSTCVLRPVDDGTRSARESKGGSPGI